MHSLDRLCELLVHGFLPGEKTKRNQGPGDSFHTLLVNKHICNDQTLGGCQQGWINLGDELDGLVTAKSRQAERLDKLSCFYSVPQCNFGHLQITGPPQTWAFWPQNSPRLVRGACTPESKTSGVPTQGVSPENVQNALTELWFLIAGLRSTTCAL